MAAAGSTHFLARHVGWGIPHLEIAVTRVGLVLVLSAAAGQVQQATMVGSWRVDYAAGARIENDVATPILATGTLTIKQQGDSLIGELVADVAAGRTPKPPARLAARAMGSEVTFVSKGQATIQTNHGSSQATILSTWKLRQKGDSLVGTVERVVEGLEGANAGPQPVSGKRQRG